MIYVILLILLMMVIWITYVPDEVNGGDVHIAQNVKKYDDDDDVVYTHIGIINKPKCGPLNSSIIPTSNTYALIYREGYQRL